jgi:dimethylhistidine N-methyltransferase
MSQPRPIVDHHPATDNVLQEVLDGLSSTPPQLSSKLFYDERGSQLFDRITELDEYYPMRTETAIMEAHGAEMAAAIGPDAMVVEYGAGSSIKTRILLEHLEDPVAYVPIDISRDHLRASAGDLAAAYPEIEVLPVCADYEQPITLPETSRPVSEHVVYFPGSTIGNFHRDDACRFLERAAHLSARYHDGALLIGVDLQKDDRILHAAYNDSDGVTADFNLNMLAHINRSFGADFDTARFRHVAFYNDVDGRIEMHLESRQRQSVTLAGHTFKFEQGERIWTESSYKYTVEGFSEIAARAGYQLEAVWKDPDELFSVQYYKVA